MKDEDARLTPDEEEELLGAVLRRTSGGACGRAEELLAEYADLEVGATPDPLLESHLEHCAACSELARSLAIASETLPTFVAFDPGPSFTAAVLAATSRAQPGTIAERLAAWWRVWLARPRFAFEVAYVATLLILLVVGNPASTLQAATARTASVAAAGLDRAREAWPAAVARVAPAGIELPASVRALGAGGGITSGVVAQGSGGLTSAWTRALLQWSVTWNWLRGMASDLAGQVTGTLAAIRNTVGQWINRPGTEPRTPATR